MVEGTTLLMKLELRTDRGDPFSRGISHEENNMSSPMPPPPRPSGPPNPPARPGASVSPGEVFHEALERPLDAREAFIVEACGADRSARAEVRALLAAHEAAGNFMAEDPIAAQQIEAELSRLKP